MKTIPSIVFDVHRVVVADGIDLAPSDVGYIISLFLEGIVHSSAPAPMLDAWLQQIADECSAVKDE